MFRQGPTSSNNFRYITHQVPSSGSFPKQDTSLENFRSLTEQCRRSLQMKCLGESMVQSGPCHQLELGAYNSIGRGYNPSETQV